MKTTPYFKPYLTIILCYLLNFTALAQDPASMPARSQVYELKNAHYGQPPEKIYLQIDNKLYTNDQTVWLKAIVTHAQDHTLSIISGVLHVELIDQNEQVVEKKLIRLANGIGDGFFQLNPNYKEGHYQVRAYTEWNRNFGPDFIFKEYIQVFETGSSTQPNPFQSLTLAGADNQRQIRARINPSAIDSLHTRDLTLFIASDDKRDTIKVSRSGKDNYQLDYPVSPGSHFVTLKMSTKNNSNYSRTIVLDENFLDVQFFPESGELVQGIPNLLGFKALDGLGKGIKIAGEIVNSRGDVMTTFSSNELGMGSVFMTDVDSMAKYTARLTQGKETAKGRYPLPVVIAKGNVLNIRKMRERIYLKATSNYMAGDSVTVRASCRGIAYFEFKGRLRDGHWEFLFPSNLLPEGVILFTLMNSSLQPLAERLYFNERPENRLQLSLEADKKVYRQRELTKLTLSATDSQGKPVDADLSLMVLNRGDMADAPSSRENILSYLLLSSDLKGRIEAPGGYFTGTANPYPDIDALLLTQGWRKYKYTQAPAGITFQPEQNVSVSGYVGSLFSQKREQAGVGLNMMIFGQNPGVLTSTTDSAGRFSFDISNQEGQSVDVLIQSNNKSGKQRDYNMVMDKKTAPPVSFDPVLTIQKPDSIELAYVTKSLERKKAEDAFIRATEGIALKEVVVNATALTPQKKKVEDEFGKAKTVISGDAIRKGEEKWSYGLYSVLMFKFPQVRVKWVPDTGYFAQIPNGELTLVVVDGIPVMIDNYPTIASIPPSEVKSFELIPYARNFRSLFCETFPPELCGINAPSRGNVIAIYTHAGIGLFGTKSPAGISRHTVPVFAAPREFYAPKYEQAIDWAKPDRRSLIHWQPQIPTDSSGKAEAAFYNSDNTGIQSVVVEAIAADGRVGYKEVRVEVVKR